MRGNVAAIRSDRNASLERGSRNSHRRRPRFLSARFPISSTTTLALSLIGLVYLCLCDPILLATHPTLCITYYSRCFFLSFSGPHNSHNVADGFDYRFCKRLWLPNCRGAICLLKISSGFTFVVTLFPYR